MKSSHWQAYVNKDGDFELPTFLFNTIYDLMKQSLDLGTMLSDDKAKTRAYKERVKDVFKSSWMTVAQALEFFDIIVPCTCFKTQEFCELCGGSRYQLNRSLSPGAMGEIGVVTSGDNPELTERLQKGLEKALQELGLVKDEVR